MTTGSERLVIVVEGADFRRAIAEQSAAIAALDAALRSTIPPQRRRGESIPDYQRRVARELREQRARQARGARV